MLLQVDPEHAGKGEEGETNKTLRVDVRALMAQTRDICSKS
jgi:hypothetical protein